MNIQTYERPFNLVILLFIFIFIYQALLVKQEWHIIMCPHSLVGQMLKAYYYLNSMFMVGRDCLKLWKGLI